ncbi:MAG: exodeoxyribonuclease V subunit gamma, partial [Burkholderiales bacterium]
ARAARRDPEHAEHREVRNRLLAALGAHGRAFFDQLIALEQSEVACYQDPAGSTLLARLQRDMLELVESTDILVGPSDQSIAIHVCHGPVREAEVLHDQLLARFEADPTLKPEDVLVLVPEIDRYGGAFDAVFSSAPRERFIPFTIADRVGAGERPLVRSVLALVGVGLGRLDAESVLALLDEPRIARRVDIEAHDLSRLRRWVDATGIRWGEDERAKKRHDLPATRLFTWRAGLDRLILGAAMAPRTADAVDPIAGIVPFDDIEGAGMALVGALDRLLEALGRLASDFERPRAIAAWCARITALIGEFHMLDTVDAEDANAVRDALAAIADAAIRAEDREPIPATLARRPIEQALEALGRAGHFLGGGVTIARLALGRVIPARIVCVVGLNDGVFPAADRERGFDLMRGYRTAGDRSRRDEDRYAFLGAFSAARDAFIVTYTGLSARDTIVRPPSMVLSTLLETIRASTEQGGGEDALERITVTHPLHPTSARYGGIDGRLFTYATEWRASAVPPAQRAFAAGLRIAPSLLTDIDDLRGIDLTALEQFIGEPARHTLRLGLGVTLHDEDARIDAVEPFTLDPLDRYALRDDLLEGFLGGRDPARMNATLASTGRTPEGPVGIAILAREEAVAAEITEAVQSAVGVSLAWAPPVVLDLTIEVTSERSDGCWWRVRGQLDRCTLGGQVVATPGRINERRILSAWVRHLGLNAEPALARTADAMARRTFLIGRPVDDSRGKLAIYEFRAMTAQAATERLAELLAVVAAAEVGFVPFYAEAAFAFYAAELAGDEDPLEAARKSWTPNAFARRTLECERPYIALATRDDPSPFNASFAALARRVFGPLAAQSTVFDAASHKNNKKSAA